MELVSVILLLFFELAFPCMLIQYIVMELTAVLLFLMMLVALVVTI